MQIRAESRLSPTDVLPTTMCQAPPSHRESCHLGRLQTRAAIVMALLLVPSHCKPMSDMPSTLLACVIPSLPLTRSSDRVFQITLTPDALACIFPKMNLIMLFSAHLSDLSSFLCVIFLHPHWQAKTCFIIIRESH